MLFENPKAAAWKGSPRWSRGTVEAWLASHPQCSDQPKPRLLVPPVHSRMKAKAGHPECDEVAFAHRVALWRASPLPSANGQIWSCFLGPQLLSPMQPLEGVILTSQPSVSTGSHEGMKLCP
ncbi:hypothetical protein HJG60_011897 [Phyllostomus discolor]|uniref:Uncharacterized protein n=1 Tax=Phyllostomus discolor TaxID=89673 RepID=A0A833ZNY4_9CHIR|nr:hypothetical protein HJG60_011897 [Phyllostomus discolor]